MSQHNHNQSQQVRRRVRFIMATPTDRTRFWADTGTTSAVFSESEVDAIFDEAGESSTDLGVVVAMTRTIAIGRLLASSAKLSDYKQNQSSESRSQIFKNLQNLLSIWEKKLVIEKSSASKSGAARLGGTRRRPARVKEYPNG